jgi:RimJ/RimL family protein N-acetyltransferase
MLVTESEVVLRDGRRVWLRSPREADVALVLPFLVKLTKESWKNLNHPASYFARMTKEAESTILRDLEAHPKSFFIGAFTEAGLVGNVGCRMSPATVASHCGDIGIGILEAYQGVGLGTVLFGRAVEEATRVGLVNLTLRVRTFNAVAIRLYEKLGFERVGTLRAVARIEDAFADEYLYQRVAP